jgi:D-3-phosphoglycerate dehydrogenase
MKPFIVVADGFDKNLFEHLCSLEQFDVHPESKISQEKLTELLPKIDGLVIRSATHVNPDLLEKATNLKYVIRAGEGTDNIDKVACGQKNVKVSNTPGANNNSAAEHAMALIMTTLRKTSFAHASMCVGKWEKALFTGNELWKKKVGIIGFGRIGQILAKRLQGFEVEVLFYDPFVEKSDLTYATKHETIDSILAEADVVSIHVPLMDATRNLIGKTQFDQMKNDAIIVNAARGGIVNEDDLLEALKNKSIRAAAFDVFAKEPLDENSPLRKLNNMILTPHLGASTEEAQVRVGEMAAHQLSEFFTNNNLLNEVKA